MFGHCLRNLLRCLLLLLLLIVKRFLLSNIELDDITVCFLDSLLHLRFKRGSRTRGVTLRSVHVHAKNFIIVEMHRVDLIRWLFTFRDLIPS